MPISVAIGQIRHVLRPASVSKIIEAGELAISPRRKAPTFRLDNGETVLVTTKRRQALPVGIDGVLRRADDGSHTWVTHRQLEAFNADIARVGFAKRTEEFRTRWRETLKFRMEEVDQKGHIQKTGLRPPQFGALHAIGAHWSLFQQAATIVMPTGTGKTETMLSALAAYSQGPVLVIVPSDILRSQTARKFLTFGLLRQLGILPEDAPNPIVGIVTKRPRTASDLDMIKSCNVIVGTMSSLGDGSAASLAGDVATRIDTLIVDEAHHIGAAGWSGFREALTNCKILQFTATPFRRDGKLVDGTVIYNYPLRLAQKDGYFKPIKFEPVYELDADAADAQIAEAAVEKLKEDLAAGYDHLMMARCRSIDRAKEVHRIYERLAPEFRPMLVHSDLTDTDTRLRDFRAGTSRIAVCVNMLGEGFDLPELKIAAVHDLHKSLAVLLQFTGRFTRSASKKIGNATIIANIADVDVSTALERLYSEDADWNQLLSELSTNAAQEHAELVAFLNSSERLDQEDDERLPISQQLLRPPLSTLCYRATEFHPKRFHLGLPKSLEVHRVWLHDPSHTLFFVTKSEPAIDWARSKALRDRQWALFILHYDPALNLLFVSSTDHSSTHELLAKAVGATDLISGDVIFRTLGKINRLMFQNVGVRKHGRRNLGYAMYTGSDVAQALSLSEKAGSVKSNLNGTGWEDGKFVTIGCSYKGRIWSRERGPIPDFVKWSARIGAKLLDDTIDTREIISNVLIPEPVTSLPDKEVLGLEWPLELLGQSEERIALERGTDEQSLGMFSIEFVQRDVATSTLDFDLVEATSGPWVRLRITVGGEERFTVSRVSGAAVNITAGKISLPIEQYFSDYPPLVRFVDLTELDGDLLIKPQDPQSLSFPEERFEVWDWQGVDLKRESIWKDNQQRADSIQSRAAKHFIDGGFDVVFNDDGAGEAADLVCMKEEPDHIHLALVHCKFSGGASPGERVKDVVEVASQAVRSAKWKWKFKDLCRHIQTREKNLSVANYPTRFLAGRAADLSRFLKASRFKEIRPDILIVQPGLSMHSRSKEQEMVLAAALNYLKETIGVNLDIICSA